MMRAILLPAMALLLAACAANEADDDCCEATIIAEVPDGAPAVFLADDLEALGPWRADGMRMEGDRRERVARLRAPAGTDLQYKFTLGAWDREALGPTGMAMPNFRLRIDRDVEVRHEIADFKKDAATYIADWRGSGALGTLVYWTDVGSAFLDEKRHVEVWLPPGYDENPEKRYKVLYMSDGQNLFDPRIANTGTDWGVDEAIMALAEEGAIDPPIVVGVWSSSRRGEEYSPWHKAPDYARFLTEELAPRINKEFRTLTGPRNTSHMGSSIGGLLSFHLVMRRPDAFGACGCVSTHFPLPEAIVAQYFPNVAPADNPDPTPYIVRDIEKGLDIPPGGWLSTMEREGSTPITGRPMTRCATG